jgi:hypothetical protein
MMLIIEYINVVTGGRRFDGIRKSPWRQVLLGATLGVIPGCMGGFAAVSLFSHNIFGFGGLVAAMISDTGDETFVMFAMMPEYAFLIKGLTFAVAVVAGLGINVFISGSGIGAQGFDHELEIHSDCESPKRKISTDILRNLAHPSVQRIVVLSGIAVFMLGLGLGMLEHDHDHAAGHAGACAHHAECGSSEHEHEHDQCREHSRGTHSVNSIFSERWLNLLFLFVAAGAFVVVLSVDEHFLKEHIFRHVVGRHLFRVFVWTFGSLAFIYLLGLFVRYDEWIHDNRVIMLFIALLIGLIPQSGPHIAFVSLFASGTIPFSILLANSIVQNGHSGLPLLAETKRGFVNTKLAALAAGLAVGLAGFFAGF